MFTYEDEDQARVAFRILKNNLKYKIQNTETLGKRRRDFKCNEYTQNFKRFQIDTGYQMITGNGSLIINF